MVWSVNFLLHHAFARAEVGSAVAGIGAMLPDLWRMAHPRVRPRRDAGSTVRSGSGDEGAGDLIRELERGIAHHLAIDAWFHDTEVFREGEQALAARFSCLGVPKLRLLAHPAWELCLDGALVRRSDPMPAVRVGFREAAPALDEVAEQHGATRLDEATRRRFRVRMQAFADALIEGPWIQSYSHAGGLVSIVEGLRTRRLGLSPLGDSVRRDLGAIFAGLERDADEALGRLFALRERAVSYDSESTATGT